METKAFSTAALASITTGRLFCAFSDMHEAIEYLMGHPVWTHELASEALFKLMSAKLREQHPGLPTEADDCDGTNWEAWRDQLVAKLGPTLTITKGQEVRAADPITTARNILGPDKPIIAIGTGGE